MQCKKKQKKKERKIRVLSIGTNSQFLHDQNYSQKASINRKCVPTKDKRAVHKNEKIFELDALMGLA